MSIVSTTQDAETLTLTIVAELAAPPARVWQVWSDPRQLERWWGPSTWPATFEEHDVVVGGGSRCSMTGPEGEKAGGGGGGASWLSTSHAAWSSRTVSRTRPAGRTRRCRRSVRGWNSRRTRSAPA